MSMRTFLASNAKRDTFYLSNGYWF